MTYLMVTADQAEVLSHVDSRICVRDPQGKVIGFFNQASPAELEQLNAFTLEEIEEAERRAEQTTSWLTTAEIFERVQKLVASKQQ